jgi:hypothetical protein
MRVPFLLPAAGLVAFMLTASPGLSAGPSFDVTGTWAAEGKGCSDADLFVEFDGRDILAQMGPSTKARVAANYSAALEGDRLVVNLTKIDTKEGDAWSFVVDGSNRMRLDSAFFASAQDGGGLMKLTRCSRT